MKRETVNRLWLYAMGALILAGGVWGFGHKFYALVTLALQKDGPADAAFAVAPVVNYLLASFSSVGRRCMACFMTSKAPSTRS